MRNKLLENWICSENRIKALTIIEDAINASDLLVEAVDDQTLRNFRKYLKQGQRVAFDVDSSAIERVEYDPIELELIITFPDGSEYIYYNVRPRRVERLMRSDSHGSFFFHNIRTSFAYDEI